MNLKIYKGVSTTVLFIFLAVGVVPVLISCGSMPGAARPEPALVAISNGTPHALLHVEAKERPLKDLQPARLASVSQLLPGSMFTLQRRAGARSLTDDVMVSWEWPDGRKAVKIVSIASALRDTEGLSDEALIFTILPDGNVLVKVDVLPSAMGNRP